MTDRNDASRRTFVKGNGALATAGLLAGCNGFVEGATEAKTTTSSDDSHASPDLAKFVADLPTPETMRPAGREDGHPHYEVTMQEATQSFHPDLGDTAIWGYEGRFPGPTFEVERGQTVSVHWANDELPSEHLFPVDTTLPARKGEPQVRNVVHVHGSTVDSIDDGHPEAWYTPDGTKTGSTPSPRRRATSPASSPTSASSTACFGTSRASTSGTATCSNTRTTR